MSDIDPSGWLSILLGFFLLGFACGRLLRLLYEGDR